MSKYSYHIVSKVNRCLHCLKIIKYIYLNKLYIYYIMRSINIFVRYFRKINSKHQNKHKNSYTTFI